MNTPWSARLIHAPRRLLIASVRGYRYALSPWLGSSCRFEPSCSAYALEALERHGAGAGILLTAGRVLRCHPWCEGGRDDVPPRGRAGSAGLFSAFVERGSAVDTIRRPRRVEASLAPLTPHSLLPVEKNLP